MFLINFIKTDLMMESEIRQIENSCADITLLTHIDIHNITFVQLKNLRKTKSELKIKNFSLHAILYLFQLI